MNIRNMNKNYYDSLEKQISGFIHDLEKGTPLHEMDREELLEVLKQYHQELTTTWGKENLYRLVADHAYNLGYLLTGDKEKLLYVTPSCKRITGFSEDEFYDNPHLFSEIIHPEDATRFSKKSVCDYPKDDFRIIKKDGEVRWITYSSQKIYDEDGSLMGIRVSGRDITERKKAEEKLRKTERKLRDIVEHSTNLFYSHTPDHYLTYVSPQSRSYFGYEPEEASVRWLELLTDHPANAKGLEITTRAIESGKPQPPYELELKKRDGDIIWVEVNEAPVVKNGKTVLVVGSLTDITARKKADELVRKSLKEKEVLLTEIHHRVKNNIAVISGMLALDAEEQQDPIVKASLLKSESRIRSMAMIHDKLYQEENFSEIEFGTYIRELTAHIRQHFMSEEVHIDTIIDAEKIYLEMTRAVPCGLLLNELVTNGFKHAFQKRSKGTIRLRFYRNGASAILRYEDDGPGLPGPVIQQIKSGSSKSLGMNLIHGLTQQLQGVFTAENRPGACLKIAFPVDVGNG